MAIQTQASGIESPSGKSDLIRYKAAIWAGYKPQEFCEQLNTEWQAELIAAYLVDRQSEAVIQEDIERQRETARPVRKKVGPLVK
jgi:hypothetical protein